MSHNLVTIIQKKLTLSKIATQSGFHRVSLSILSIWLSIPQATQETSQFLLPNLISVSPLASDAICGGTSLRIRQALIVWSVTNQVMQRAGAMLCVHVTVVSLTRPLFDYFLVEKSLAALAIVRRQSQESAYALHMLSGMVWLQCCMSETWQLQELSDRPSHNSYLSHRSSRLRPAILVASIHQASSGSAENSPCGAVLFLTFCPSPSQVHHLHWPYEALYHLHHLHRLLYHPHCLNLQDHSDCLR